MGVLTRALLLGARISAPSDGGPQTIKLLSSNVCRRGVPSFRWRHRSMRLSAISSAIKFGALSGS